MAERPLNERFIDLEDRMISVEALTRYGTANDLRFYILIMRQRMNCWFEEKQRS